MLVTILLAAGTMLLLAVLGAFILGWANKTFHVEVDPRIDQINDVLPGANCGGCGYVGCNEYSEAVVAGECKADLCTVGGASCAEQVAAIAGVEVTQSWPYRPVVHCGASYNQRKSHMIYKGEKTCGSANVINGLQGCTYGCMGFGDCETSCDFDAIHIIDGLAVVDYEKCVGCGACEKACPRHIIAMVPFKSEKMLVITCSNTDMGKEVKAVCEVGCIGCKACERASDGALKIHNNLPQIDYDSYDPATMDAAIMGMKKCPMKRLLAVGKPSDKDLEQLQNEATPAIVTPDFKTTVDETTWRG